MGYGAKKISKEEAQIVIKNKKCTEWSGSMSPYLRASVSRAIACELTDHKEPRLILTFDNHGSFAVFETEGDRS